MLIVNGTNLNTIGFTYATRRLPGLGGTRSIVQPVPGRVPVRLGSMQEAAQLQVDGWWKGASHAEVLTRRDSLVALLRGECVIRFDDITDREWVGYLDPQSRDDAVTAAEKATEHSATLVFTLPDPAARAQAQTSTNGTSTALVLGTAESPLRITVTNGATAPITRVVVRVRDGGGSGTILRELQWDGSVATNDVLVIDASTMQVTNDGANAINGLTAASEFPIADPAEGADHVTITVTGGGGHTVNTAYRRRWW